jgi:hypothetical protein
VKEGVIEFDYTPITPYFIYQFHELFMLNVVACEFYSDFSEKHIEIDPAMIEHTIDKAKDEGGLYQYYDKKAKHDTDTYYSPDYYKGRKSLFICYDKIEQLLHDGNKASKEEILKKQNRYRCEIRLTSGNSSWLNWDNFRGNYKNIYNRYLKYLSTIYNNYIDGTITIHGEENPNFKKMVKEAKDGNKIRKSDKKLKQTEKRTRAELAPEKVLTAEEVKDIKDKNEDRFNEFSLKKQNIKKAQKMNEMVQKEVKEAAKTTEKM